MGSILRSIRHGFLSAPPLALILLATSAFASWNQAGEPIPVGSCGPLDLWFASCDDGGDVLACGDPAWHAELLRRIAQ